MKFSRNSYAENIFLSIVIWLLATLMFGLIYILIIYLLRQFFSISDKIFDIFSLLAILFAFFYLYKTNKRFSDTFKKAGLKYRIINIAIIIFVLVAFWLYPILEN